MSGVLLDTSIWRGYFTGKLSSAMARVVSNLLDSDADLLVHPAVLGELVLGGLSPREEALLRQLPVAPELPSSEVLEFVAGRKLMRRGIGWVDAQLLASALDVEAGLWSLDKALAKAAFYLKTAFDARPLQ
jgi:predicted nucleic acid-binding protein